jgi:dGTP triphosphohydrolase
MSSKLIQVIPHQVTPNKILKNLIRDLVIQYKKQSTKYDTQNLICYMKFYPSIEKTNSIKRQWKKLEKQGEFMESIIQRKERKMEEPVESERAQNNNLANDISINIEDIEMSLQKDIYYLRELKDTLSGQCESYKNKLHELKESTNEFQKYVENMLDTYVKERNSTSEKLLSDKEKLIKIQPNDGNASKEDKIEYFRILQSLNFLIIDDDYVKYNGSLFRNKDLIKICANLITMIGQKRYTELDSVVQIMHKGLNYNYCSFIMSLIRDQTVRGDKNKISQYNIIKF